MRDHDEVDIKELVKGKDKKSCSKGENKFEIIELVMKMRLKM